MTITHRSLALAADMSWFHNIDYANQRAAPPERQRSGHSAAHRLHLLRGENALAVPGDDRMFARHEAAINQVTNKNAKLYA